MSDASLEPIEARALAIFIFVFIALVDDICLAMFTAALNNGDASDELVHDVLPIVGVKIACAVRCRARPGSHSADGRQSLRTLRPRSSVSAAASGQPQFRASQGQSQPGSQVPVQSKSITAAAG